MEQKEKKVLTAYEKAAENENIDPRCIPQALAEAPPIGQEIQYPDYPETDHDNWNILFERQMQYLPGRVCDEYLEGTKILGMTPDRLPALKVLSANLKKATGWEVARIPGLILARNFFELLEKRQFPSTDYIRGKEELDYTPAPDMFHDIFGHMPMLTNPNFADFYQKFGKAALNASDEQNVALERLHWFTVEFGLIKKPEGMRIYGAGIISSKNEVTHALSDKVEVVDFDTGKIAEQEYEVWHLQPKLFAIESFEQLEEGFDVWCKKEGLL